MGVGTTGDAAATLPNSPAAPRQMASGTLGTRRARGRLRWLAAAILGWALLYVFLYVPARGNGSDFQDFYAAAYADAHGVDVYNWPALWRVEQIVYNGGVGHSQPFYFVPYGNPPPFALLLRPLTALPETVAYPLWAALILLSTAGGAYLGLASWPRAQRIVAAVLVTLSPAALFNVRLGQSSSLLLLGLGAAIWLLHRRRPVLAGAALTLGMVKPHLAVPLAAIAICAAPREQRRAALAGFLAATASWAAVAVVADGGPGVFGHWWASIHNYLGSIRLQPDVASIPGIYYGSAPAAMIGPLNGLCLAAACAVIVALAWRARGGGRQARALLFGGGIAAYCALSPYVHTGDQVVLALPLLALIGPDGQGLRGNAVLLAATAIILAPMVVFRDYHTEVINALPPLCLALAYALRDRRSDPPHAAAPDEHAAHTAAVGVALPCDRSGGRIFRLIPPRAPAMAEALLTARAPTTRGDATAHASARLATPWADLIMAAIGLRILVSLIGAGIMLLLPRPGQAHDLGTLLLAPWRHFDALWFTQIAAHGYGSSPFTTAYMPLYPLLIHVVAIATGGHYLTAALIVSNLSLIAAVGLFWRWVAEMFSDRVAWRAVALLLVFPDAFFLVGAYSESTFLALSAGCLLALRRDRPLLAGALALLATLTRLQGLVLVVPILLALRPRAAALLQRGIGKPVSRSDPLAGLKAGVFSARGQAPVPALVRGLAGAALPLLGFALYQRLLTAALHGGGIFATYRDQWHIPLQAPWQTIWAYISVIRSPRWHLFHSPAYNYILLWDLLIALAALAALLASWRRMGWELTVFGLAGWCFLMTRWYSTGRYMLSVLLFFVALALWTDGQRRFRWYVTASALMLLFFAAEFAQNSWVD